MARLARLSLAGHPHHIIQRGNNRQAVFSDDEDRRTFLAVLGEHARQRGIALHAYVLLKERFHLLATPATDEATSQWMQAVGRRYVRLYNQRHGRTGTLWEGRYRSNLIQADRYLLNCMVCFDLEAVRAGEATQPAGHAWSSHSHYTGTKVDPWVTPHPVYWALGDTPFAREQAYALQVQAGVDESIRRRLITSALQGWALAEPDHLDRLRQQTSRRLEPLRAGRPRKPSNSSAPN